jgi:alkanesulfonate monooxygenase SsuD/methylene tetrahydromethanopterin reductase-like flavin-dependent oxidoreductase (luciferase family)
VWLLGSSDYSAQLAASLGLPYVFANHFSGEGLERALALYRTGYQPSEAHPEPITFLTANAIAAPTAEEAEERALPQLRMMARLRQNKPLVPLETVEQAKAGYPTSTDSASRSWRRLARSGSSERAIRCGPSSRPSRSGTASTRS